MNLTKLKSKKFEITEISSLVKIETKISRSKNMAEEQILCVLCHMEEKRERIVHRLGKRRIPADLWDYFLKSPEHWDFGDTTEDGLQKGISAILMSPYTVAPCWVEKESFNKFVNLKMKMTAVTQVVAEIKRFSDEELP